MLSSQKRKEKKKKKERKKKRKEKKKELGASGPNGFLSTQKRVACYPRGL